MKTTQQDSAPPLTGLQRLMVHWHKNGRHIYEMRRLNYALFGAGLVGQVLLLWLAEVGWLTSILILVLTVVASLHFGINLGSDHFVNAWEDVFDGPIPPTVFATNETAKVLIQNLTKPAGEDMPPVDPLAAHRQRFMHGRFMQ